MRLLLLLLMLQIWEMTGEILNDINSLYSDLDNRELEPLWKQFKQSKSPTSLEGKVNIPVSDKSYGMEDRTQIKS